MAKKLKYIRKRFPIKRTKVFFVFFLTQWLQHNQMEESKIEANQMKKEWIRWKFYYFFSTVRTLEMVNISCVTFRAHDLTVFCFFFFFKTEFISKLNHQTVQLNTERFFFHFLGKYLWFFFLIYFPRERERIVNKSEQSN